MTVRVGPTLSSSRNKITNSLHQWVRCWLILFVCLPISLVRRLHSSEVSRAQSLSWEYLCVERKHRNDLYLAKLVRFLRPKFVIGAHILVGDIPSTYRRHRCAQSQIWAYIWVFESRLKRNHKKLVIRWMMEGSNDLGPLYLLGTLSILNYKAF
jgi:hypothetical protein